MQSIYGDQNGRKCTLLTFNGSFGGASLNDDGSNASAKLNQEGEALLREYKRRFAQEVFDKNILFSFECIFEAGYLSKYKSIIW